MNASFRGTIVLALLMASPLAIGHDLEADVLTVVLREGNHVSLTFRVDEVSLMHRMLSPRSTDAEFLLPLSAMGEEAFAVVVRNFRKRLEKEIVLRDATGRPLTLTDWHWPDIAESRQRIRQLTAQRIVGDAAHEHLPPTIITADALGPNIANRLDLQLPGVLDGLTVVSYRPRQQIWRSAAGNGLSLQF